MGNFLYVIKDEKKTLFKKGSIIPVKKKEYGYNYYSKKKIYNYSNVKTKN